MVTRASTPLPSPRDRLTYGEAIFNMVRLMANSGNTHGGAIEVGDTTIIVHPGGIDSLPTEDYLNIVAELRLKGKL